MVVSYGLNANNAKYSEILETWQLSTVWARNCISKHTISMSKSAGYFQNFPVVYLKIESNNKRGRQIPFKILI